MDGRLGRALKYVEYRNTFDIAPSDVFFKLGCLHNDGTHDTNSAVFGKMFR